MSLSGLVPKRLFSAFFAAFLLTALPTFAYAGEAQEAHPQEQEFSFKELVFHHLLDAYDWEFYRGADGEYKKISLPRILIYEGELYFYGSTEAALRAGWVDAHHLDHNAKHGALLAPGAASLLHGNGHHADSDAIAQYKPLDFSITKNVVYMLLAAIVVLLIMTAVARGYKKREGQAPKGIQSFFEPIVVFIRDDVAKDNIPHHYERFTPFLLTMFFFIWISNMIGLTPFSGNVTGNIAVTLTLALITLVVVNFSGKKFYWKHVLWPDVPHWLKPLIIPLEIVGIFSKPFALTVRLFANISGGHVVILAFISLIFILSKMGQQVALGYTVSFLSSLFIVAIGLLELFVALLQAYVFTMLSAVFIGQAVESDH